MDVVNVFLFAVGQKIMNPIFKWSALQEIPFLKMLKVLKITPNEYHKGREEPFYRTGSRFPKVTSNVSHSVSRNEKHKVQVTQWLRQMLSNTFLVNYCTSVTHLLEMSTLWEESE